MAFHSEKSIICPSPNLQIEKFCRKTLPEIATLKAAMELELLQVVPASHRLRYRTSETRQKKGGRKGRALDYLVKSKMVLERCEYIPTQAEGL